VAIDLAGDHWLRKNEPEMSEASMVEAIKGEILSELQAGF
jgi:hypothetical protein